MKIKNIIISILCMLIFLVTIISTSANPIWKHEANAGLNLPGSDGDLGYASNYNNIVENNSYSICQIEGSTITPLSSDFDDDNIPDIVIIDANTLKIYDSNCEIIYSLILNETPKDAVISNLGFDDQQDEIILLMDTTLQAYEYNSTTEKINNVLFSNYTTQTNKIDLDKIDCVTQKWVNSDSTGCIMAEYGSRDLIVYYYVNDSYDNRSNVVPATTYSLTYNNGIAGTFTQTDTYQIPICYKMNSTLKFECNIFYNEAIYNRNYAGLVSSSFEMTDLYYMSSFIAKVGASYRFFLNAEYRKGGFQYNKVARVYDLTGNLLYLDDSTTFTNWMIGDYLGTGENLACYIKYNGSATLLNCFDSTFSVQLSQDITSIGANITKNYVMGAFVSNQTKLGFAYSGGIFYTDTGFIFTSNKSINSNTSSIIVSNPYSGSPIVVIGDSSNRYIIRDTVISQNCGNDICDTFESSFSCPSDCGVQSELECVVDTDCPDNFPTCLSNQCVRGANSSNTCIDDGDCNWQTPICFTPLGICVEGIRSDYYTTDPATGEEVLIGDAFDDAIDTMTGGSTKLKFFIGIIIIIAVTVAFSQKIGGSNPVIPIIIAFIMTILVTIIGLIPIFVLVLILVFLICMAVLMRFLFHG